MISETATTLQFKPKPVRQAKLILLFILTLLWSLHWMTLSVFAAQDNPTAEQLKQKAQAAYVNGLYAEAATVNLEIAEKHPDSEVRRYAVQMLGNLYEENLVDIRKAIKWRREYQEKYATPRQVWFYKEKLASLERLLGQEQAFADYQTIRFANEGDEVLAEKLDALLRKYPDFHMKARVQKELGYVYARLDKRSQSYQAFEELSKSGDKEFTASDREALEQAGRHWKMTTVWAGIAWGVVVMLWVAVLLMKPWERLTQASLRFFIISAVLWLLLSASRIPSFYAINVSADEVLFQDSAVYIAAVLNLPVLFWLLLLTRGKFRQARHHALLWLSPVLTILMTSAVFYLFLIYQPDGPKIMDAFAAKYRHWASEAKQNTEQDRSGAGPEKAIEIK